MSPAEFIVFLIFAWMSGVISLAVTITVIAVKSSNKKKEEN